MGSRTRPAFEKLLIGPVMVFGEMVTGKHKRQQPKEGCDDAPTQRCSGVVFAESLSPVDGSRVGKQKNSHITQRLDDSFSSCCFMFFLPFSPMASCLVSNQHLCKTKQSCDTGGHYMEVLRLGKQLSVGTQQTPPSFYSLHRSFITESKTGFAGAFYRGFLPWGLFQTAKGIPVLFVQNESMYQLQNLAGWSKDSAEKASGFIGGASQALFVTPFQKIKVSNAQNKRETWTGKSG